MIKLVNLRDAPLPTANLGAAPGTQMMYPGNGGVVITALNGKGAELLKQLIDCGVDLLPMLMRIAPPKGLVRLRDKHAPTMGAVGQWVKPGQKITEAQPTFKQVKYVIRKLGG